MRKKVLFLMQLPPPIHGASLVNKNITESSLIKENFDTKILELRFTTTLEEMGSFSLKKIALIFPFTFRLIKLLTSFKPDLVYFTIVPKGFAFYRDAFFTLIIKLLGKKIAFHLHSRGIQQEIQHSRIKRAIYRMVFRNQTAIALADSLKTEFDGLNTKQILVLPNGIPSHSQNYIPPQRSIPELIFLANLFVNKGILLFIEIIKELRLRNLNFTARIIGKDGDLTAEDIKYIIKKESLSAIINFSGALYGNKKYEALAEASIFVHPSLDEAFPLTILEAKQFSLAVIGSSVGAIPDMIENGKTGFTCEPGNIIEFTDKIEVLINDPLLRKNMGEKNYTDFIQNYTLNKFENNLKQVIERSIY